MKANFTVNEGGKAHEHSYDHHLEFFSKAGSLFEKSGSFYGEQAKALDLFKPAWIADPETAFKLMLWLRDCRGGAGNRSGFRSCLRWVAEVFPEWVEKNLHWIPVIGRWDDLRTLFGTDLEEIAAGMWWYAIGEEKHVLAAKWADRSDKPLFLKSGLKEIGDFRRFLARIRSPHIVESKMCAKQWNKVDYEKLPSVAMARYTKAFARNDAERFESYKASLVKGEAKVNAGALFPHDCVRTCFNGDTGIADAQFDALPNYMEDSGEKAIVIADTSASMNSIVSGSVRAVHVSQGMALYCSAKIGKDNPFYKKFIGFSNEGSFVNWDGMSFSQAVRNRAVFNGAVGHTRIDRALDLILDTAKFFKIEQDKMPTALIIVSDMQFAGSGQQGGPYYGGNYGTKEPVEQTMTEVQKSFDKWVKAGYNIPKIIYWNTAGYAGNVDTKYAKNVALVSGFSPAILKNIFNGEDLTPLGVMREALKKYVIEVP